MNARNTRSTLSLATSFSMRIACGLLALGASHVGAQQAQFFAIPGQSTTPGSNSNFCGLSGTTGYSGVRVSADGSTVATVVFSPGAFAGYIPRQGAYWTEATGTVVVSPDVDGLYPITGISADGQVIYGDQWRWTATGGYENLVPLLGNGLFQTRTIFGCSDDGRIVTGVDGTYPSQGDLFRWPINAVTPVLLPRDPAFPDGYFYFNTISGDGQVVAGSARRLNGLGNGLDSLASVIVTASGTTVITPESSQEGVTDLSYDGRVAVGYTSQGFQLRAFYWTSATGITLLDSLGGSNSSYARAVDSGGTTVVGDYLNFGQPGTRAWMWTASTGFVDLQNDLVANYGLGAALAGWQLNVATDVSADGRTIVGQATNPNGCEQAFLVRLPAGNSTIESFCFGDGSGNACPCGNTGGAGRGCANSVNANGARLIATGLAKITNDTLVLRTAGLTNGDALYVQGSSAIGGGSGVVFGDGLRCVGGTIRRLGSKGSSLGASIYPAPGDAKISAVGAVTAPGTYTYQAWYRNAANFCTPSTFNWTNGVRVTWGL